jgi:hypothetical protein
MSGRPSCCHLSGHLRRVTPLPTSPTGPGEGPGVRPRGQRAPAREGRAPGSPPEGRRDKGSRATPRAPAKDHPPVLRSSLRGRGPSRGRWSPARPSGVAGRQAEARPRWRAAAVTDGGSGDGRAPRFPAPPPRASCAQVNTRQPHLDAAPGARGHAGTGAARPRGGRGSALRPGASGLGNLLDPASPQGPRQHLHAWPPPRRRAAASSPTPFSARPSWPPGVPRSQRLTQALVSWRGGHLDLQWRHAPRSSQGSWVLVSWRA